MDLREEFSNISKLPSGPVGRLAPTPSGYLHIGNAYNFILTWLLIRIAKGTLALRIDDCDAARTRDEFLDDIFFSLEWLSLDFDIGPSSTAEFKEKWSQQYKTDKYFGFLQMLRRGGLALYACECSRKDIREHSTDGSYPLTCRQKRLDLVKDVTALRVRLPDDAQDLNTSVGDIVIWRKDGLPAYQLVSLAEDTWLKTNLIVRGEDLRSSTAFQKWLAGYHPSTQTFLNAKFVHHALIVDSEGKKLSKSRGSNALKAMREEGRTPEQLFTTLAKDLGVKEPLPKNAKELLDAVANLLSI